MDRLEIRENEYPTNIDETPVNAQNTTMISFCSKHL